MTAKPFLVAGAIAGAMIVSTVTSVASAQMSPPPPAAVPSIPVENIPGRTLVVGGPNMEKDTVLSKPPNRTLLAASVALIGIPYLASVAVAATTDRGSNNNLYIPVAGPWIALGNRDCSEPTPCSSKWLGSTLLVADGIAQGLGVIGIAASFVVPEKVTTIKVGKSGAKVSVAPSRTGRDGYGVAAVGEF
jgi:hypothetical protein